MYGRAAGCGRACAEYSQRILPYYLLFVNRHCEVLDSKLARQWGVVSNKFSVLSFGEERRESQRPGTVNTPTS